MIFQLDLLILLSFISQMNGWYIKLNGRNWVSICSNILLLSEPRKKRKILSSNPHLVHSMYQNLSLPENGVHVVVKCLRQAILNMSQCGNWKNLLLSSYKSFYVKTTYIFINSLHCNFAAFMSLRVRLEQISRFLTLCMWQKLKTKVPLGSSTCFGILPTTTLYEFRKVLVASSS